MGRIVLALFGVLGVIASPTVGSAQAAHQERGKSTEFHLSSAIVIGDKTVKPGDYKFECKKINEVDTLVVTSLDDNDEVVRVPCIPVILPTKVQVSQYRTTKLSGTNVLTEVQIKGETVAHLIVIS